MSNYDLTKEEMKWLIEELAKEANLDEGGCGDMHSPATPQMPHNATNMTITGEMDHEVSMASRQLDKTARYAQSLSSRMDMAGEANLPAWVQAKITKASDYISKVYHYLEDYL